MWKYNSNAIMGKSNMRMTCTEGHIFGLELSTFFTTERTVKIAGTKQAPKFNCGISQILPL
jgi:hypothetical protein